MMRLLGAFGDQTPGGPTIVTGGPPVELPPLEECATPPRPDGRVRAGRCSSGSRVRLRPDDAGFRTASRPGGPRSAGWFAFADERPIDALALLLAADAFPPAVFNIDLPVAWVPTVELTVHVRGVPAPGPLRAVPHRFVHGGLFEEDGEVWDRAGTLVALSRQLALDPRPARLSVQPEPQRPAGRSGAVARAGDARSRRRSGAGDADRGHRRRGAADDRLRALAEDHDRPAVAAGVRSSRPSGLTATGWPTASSIGRSLAESL